MPTIPRTLAVIVILLTCNDGGAAETASFDDLFSEPPASQEQADPAAAELEGLDGGSPESLDELFGEPLLDQTGAVEEASKKADSGPPLTGFFQNELAYTYGSPQHWSKIRNRLYLSSTGKYGSLPWKLSGRLDYDPLYFYGDYYPDEVRKDQRFEAQIREAYIDIPAGDWEFRLGRQHIIWGEMVGLFFADVVSAKDLRELALPDFELLRIPQWAGRAEYFAGDFHAEAVWIPYMTYDDIGKPGAEFYPFTPPPGTSIADELKPHGADDDAFGLRLSYLLSGWDMSGFFYASRDSSASFARRSPTLWQPEHGRIRQFGATVGKDLGPMVLKGEAVYSRGKRFNTTDPLDSDGLVRQDLLDAIVSLEWYFPQETRFNFQFYQRRFSDHDPNIIPKDVESGFSVLYSTEALHPNLESKILFLSSLDRNDWLTQAKLTWRQGGAWRVAMGADIFGGSSGLFGQFDNRDRVYTELRYDF